MLDGSRGQLRRGDGWLGRCEPQRANDGDNGWDEEGSVDGGGNHGAAPAQLLHLGLPDTDSLEDGLHHHLGPVSNPDLSHNGGLTAASEEILLVRMSGEGDVEHGPPPGLSGVRRGGVEDIVPQPRMGWIAIYIPQF